MNHHLIAQAALSFLCLLQAIATVAIDLNRTHATNPLWTGHARFHLVWQGCTVVFLSALELFLLWHRGPYEAQRFDLCALLAALSPLGFLSALASRQLFGGTLSDPNGIRPAHVRVFGSVLAIDMNLAAVAAALLGLLAMIWIYGH